MLKKKRKVETAIYQWNFYVQRQICFVHLKMLRDQSRYLQESVGSTSPSPARERLAKTSPFWYIKLQEVDGKRCISFQLTEVTYKHFPQGCLMDGCLNGGSCLFDEGKDAFACSCSPQWRGEKCEMGRSKLFLFLKYDRQSGQGVKDVPG